MALTDAMLRASKPREKDWKLADEKGLYLITPKGSKLRRFTFRVNGKEKKLSLGAYPDLSLKGARRMREDARADLANDIDPVRRKRESSPPSWERRTVSRLWRKNFWRSAKGRVR